ncbi:hypothetical protein PSTG_03806 [Puccinia striiformis f. sp. tritici PST-78]|uniref:Uncharacterized protein n=1 Tax=Puccinia striiformis f. sp. tritici PST-78 TaxID=1165861 RepID=A0A0L0VUG7_9BASI|nr:hypothetical protein PSTG_03806 [Puccinia striiformis f. sp. tritici PST-78]
MQILQNFAGHGVSQAPYSFPWSPLANNPARYPKLWIGPARTATFPTSPALAPLMRQMCLDAAAAHVNCSEVPAPKTSQVKNIMMKSKQNQALICAKEMLAKTKATANPPPNCQP